MPKEVKKVVEVRTPKSPEMEEQINEICGLTEVVEEIIEETQQCFTELAQEVATGVPAQEPAPEVKASKFLSGFLEKIASQEFEQECEEVGKQLNLPKQVVAKNFLMRCLGVIGDCLGIAIETTRGFVHGLIRIISWVLTQSVNVICNVAHGLARFITLNQTAKA